MLWVMIISSKVSLKKKKFSPFFVTSWFEKAVHLASEIRKIDLNHPTIVFDLNFVING